MARADDAGPMVEFAIVTPMLMMIIMAISDFSLAFLSRNNLVSAVREGARLGAVQVGYACPAAQNPAQADVDANTAVRARVKQYLLPNGGSWPSGFSEATGITVTCPVTGYIAVGVVNYPYKPVTPVFGILKLFIGNATDIKLSATAVYRWERS
jgi:Flp pilus assembly protein TadG